MSAAYTYSTADWATWTSAGGVAACSDCLVPDGSIASMQSVFIGAANSTASTFAITNCMRKTDGNTTFLKHNNKQPDRYWVNLNDASGSFNQILIAYKPTASNLEDEGDGLRMITSQGALLSSLIGTAKYAIQVKAPFTDTDVVPLVVDKGNADSFTISLGNKEGIFTDPNVKIYLHDSNLGVYHDLTASDYSFIQNTASDASRFELVYQNSALNTTPFESVHAIAYISHNTFWAQATATIKQIECF